VPQWPNPKRPLLVTDIKRLICFCFLLFLNAGFGATPAPHRTLTDDDVKHLLMARAAMLYDEATGTIIYERSIDTPYPPASTTKLMTALLVYEMKGLDGSIVIQPEDTHVEPSSVPLIAGETVSINNLMHALLIASDNDAALTLARYVAGTESKFVEMMNARALSLGCENTHFVNPNGLPALNEYTTARDLRRIFNRVISIPVLRQICQTREFVLTTKAGSKVLINHNRLLGRYPGMGPAKTGWTLASEHTYAAAVIRDGRELQLIILHSQDKWRDAVVLFDYGFTHLPPIPPGPPVHTVSNTPVKQPSS